MSNVTFKEILGKYNDSVSAVRDLENALATLLGKAEWEDTVMSDKRRSIQVLYDELKLQRNIREELEANVYSLEKGKVEEDTQTEEVQAQTSPTAPKKEEHVDSSPSPKEKAQETHTDLESH